MRDWFESLPPRDRAMVLGGGVLALLLLAWAFLWHPLVVKARDLEAEVEGLQGQLAWMQEAAAEVRRLQRTVAGSRPQGLGGRSLLAVVDQSARSAGLAAGLKRVEPDGQARAKVRLEQVPFDNLMRWLGQIRRQYGIRALNVRLERAEGEGQVNARLSLELPKA
ncbi:MAG TPA: type II secretion system protein M [Thiotrichales bacterium]|nr:type II secretion system protein M [Thiotrichales bacterium]